jgi:putative ABC transport system permease protein
MTAVLERVEPATPPPLPPRHPSRLARWWSSWRVALRLARRDAWRGKGRALLVLLLIALPVAAVVASISFTLAQTRANTPANQALRSLGPTADARIVVAAAPVNQSIDASATGTGSGPAPTRAQILTALPTGSTLVDAGGSAPVVLEVGPWGVQDAVTVADVREPLNASRWTVVTGRLPTATTEIALSPEEIARLQAHLGDTVTVTTVSGAEHVVRLTLVGSVDVAGDSPAVTTGVVLPGTVPVDANYVTQAPTDPAHQGAPLQFLASTTRPLGWSDVRALNAIGAVVVSRSVLESPPSFCPSTAVLCLDSGPEQQADAGPVYVSDTELQNAARAAALAVVILVLIVLQVALLAGPAFAVQLRRRQRELGLVGASGGTSADLRRAVLASGLVLGVAGGALGIAIGWTTVLLLGGVLPWAPLADAGVALGLPPLPWYVLGVAAIGVVAAVVASLVPAVLAGRGDVVDALRGRRPLPALRTRTPVVGLLLGLAGIAVMAYGRFKIDGLITGVGIIVGELALVLVMPWLVVQCGRLGRHLPLSARLAVRDSGRHRLRTAAAACAIAAAAAAAVATSTWAASYAYVTSSTDVPYPPGTVAVQAFTGGTGAPSDDPATLTRRTTDVIESVAPGSPTAVMLAVAPHDAPQVTIGYGNTGSVGCLVPASPNAAPGPGQVTVSTSPNTIVADGSEWQNCAGRGAVNGSLGGEVVVLQDPSTLGLLLGPIADVSAATAELEKGGAVVLQPNSIDSKGKVVLQPAVVLPDGSQSPGTPFRVPAVEVLAGALPASVILGPKALEPGGAAAALRPDPATQTIVVAPSVADRPDRPTVAEQISLGLMKVRVQGGTIDGSLTENDGTAVQLAVIGAAALLLALLAGLMVTALALADGRSDITTLAAVGAEPRVRRRIAASSAGFVAALGCAAGVVSGLVLAWLLNPLFNRSGSQATVIHWWLVAFVLVGIPAITAAVAWLTTRSRITLTRRRD